ncbi:bcl-2-interacting killer [Pholidichthys leucotaenia]
MVEQTRRARRIVCPQAGPSEVDLGTLRISDRAARAFGRQLAVIGDQLDREFASRLPSQLPTPLHLLRPAHALAWTIYWDVHSQLWAFRGLSAAVKAWMMSTAPRSRILRPGVFTAWVSNVNPVVCPDWARGVLVTVTLVAAVTLLGALWMERKA